MASLAAAVCVLILPGLAHGVPVFKLESIGTLGDTWSASSDVNELGVVVGTSGDPNRPGGFRPVAYVGGTLRDLGTLGGFQGSATAINGAGVVVGNSTISVPPLLPQRAFVFENQRMTDLGTLGGFCAFASDINQINSIVGTSACGGPLRAFLYEKGSMAELATRGGKSDKLESFAYAVNSSKTVVGSLERLDMRATFHAAIFREGEVDDLGTLGGTNSVAFGVSDAGVIVGRSDLDSATQHAFAFKDGEMTDLGTLGGWISQAVDVNNLGDIVGVSMVQRDAFAGFLYTEGRMYDLNDLLVGQGASDWYIAEAAGINDRGQIAATALHNGTRYGVLLTPVGSASPVPEPGAGWLLLAGMGLVLRHGHEVRLRKVA